MRIHIASFMLALALLTGASVVSAQTTAQNPWAYTPMAFFWGSQATTVTNTPATTQVTSTNANSALENFWALMPMFRFFSYSPR